MSQTNYADFEPKSSSDRTVMHILYGLHTIAWASLGALAVVALIVNYIKRSDETDAVYLAHHNYMISTFWWALRRCTCCFTFRGWLPPLSLACGTCTAASKVGCALATTVPPANLPVIDPRVVPPHER
jgi:hypothetical protein